MSIELSNLAEVRARGVQQDFEQQTAFGQQPRRESSPESQPSPERRLQLSALLDPHTTSTVGFQSRLENWLSAVYSDATGDAPARRASMAASVASGHTCSSQGTYDFCDRGAPVAGSPYLSNGTSTGFFLDSPTTDEAPNRPADTPDAAAIADHASWDEISLDGSEFEMVNLETEDCLTMHLPRCLAVLRRAPPPPTLVVAVAATIGNTVMRVGQTVVALGKWWFGRAT